MSLPNLSFAPDGIAPSALSSLSGPGLPSTSISHGAGHNNAGGVLSGIGGIDKSYPVTHTGRVSSTVDPFGNARGTIHSQFFIHTDHDPEYPGTNIHNDLGDMEPHIIDVLSGPPGIVGQNKPHRFWSLVAFNRWLQEPEQRTAYGVLQDPGWFKERFEYAGVLRHEDTKGRLHAEVGNICQLFSTGKRTTAVDHWQAFGEKTIGPDILDFLQLVLMRVPYLNPMESLNGQAHKGSQSENKWVLVPYHSKDKCLAPFYASLNLRDNVLGTAIPVGTVAAIYGVPENPKVVKAEARKLIWSPPKDNSWQGKEKLHLRRLEIETSFF